MHQVNNAVVQGGKLVLSGLPFQDGQHVRVVIAEAEIPVHASISIQEVRKQLKGGVERFDEPFEPMIPVENWEMLK